MKSIKRIIILFVLLPTLLLANDPIKNMENVRSDYYAKYEGAIRSQMTTLVQEYYLKMLFDISNVGQAMFINVQEKYQTFNELYNEWQRIRLDQTISLEEKALFYASIKSSFTSIQSQVKTMERRSTELREISGEMCSADNVFTISQRYHPDLLFPVQKITFNPGEGPKIDMSYYFEVGMNFGFDGSVGYDPTSGAGSASGSINDPELSDDQKAATAAVAVVITVAICGYTLGAGCNQAGFAAAFAISAFLTNAVFKHVNKNAAEIEYSEKMHTLRGIYDDINNHVAGVHQKLAPEYEKSFLSTCQKVFIERKPEETKMDDYLASFVSAIGKARTEVDNGVRDFMLDYEKFKNNYATWLDNEIRVLSMLDTRLDKMYHQSMTTYFANQLKVDQESRDFFMSEAMPELTKLRAEQDQESRGWVNRADRLFTKYIEGEIQYNSSDKYHALPWRSFKNVIFQNLGGTQ